jgi:hypothetical protein
VKNFLYQNHTLATWHEYARCLDHACDRQTGYRLPLPESLHRHGGFYQRGVKCWAMLAVDTLANYSSAVRKRRGLLLLDFPTEALLRGLSYPHHRTDASVYPCVWMAERGVDFIMEMLSRLPVHLPQWLAVHLPQWRGPRHGDLGGGSHFTTFRQRSTVGGVGDPQTGLHLQPLRRHGRSADRSPPGASSCTRLQPQQVCARKPSDAAEIRRGAFWHPRISFFWFRMDLASSPRLTL